jgi:hypothetical protein
MNSGLTATTSEEFKVSWGDQTYEPNAAITIDTDTLTANIRPYCEDYPLIYYKVLYDSATDTYVKTDEEIDELVGVSVDDAYTELDDIVYKGVDDAGNDVYFCVEESIEGVLAENVLLSVYRREYDGSFTELAVGIDAAEFTTITDPHPALDYARYRIVATNANNGAIEYYDMPGVPINEPCIVIQWDEKWTEFNTTNEDALEDPPWEGSLLKLPYNIAVSDSYAPDVALIEYAGRKRHVSYYGTQLGETASWSADIDKEDKDTLYALRRLAIWMGDVYVREPSGSGYWANIKVKFNQSYDNLIIPVTLEVTRVEGGA